MSPVSPRHSDQLRARLLAPAGLRRDVPRRVREALPAPVQARLHALLFKARWGFDPPPVWADWSVYERLMAVAEHHSLATVPGDVVEIGVLLGGGTYKLCHWFARNAPEKRVIAVDIFDPTFDVTTCTQGDTMAGLYQEALAGRDQRSVFDEVTASCANLTVVAGDSAAIELPCERIAFAYVDGHHSAAYVRNDFELVWQRLSPGGVVGFDDYGGNLPEVTRTLHELTGQHAAEIARLWVDGPTLFLVRA
jgi:SAM-dependent methyltransferase